MNTSASSYIWKQVRAEIQDSCACLDLDFLGLQNDNSPIRKEFTGQGGAIFVYRVDPLYIEESTVSRSSLNIETDCLNEVMILTHKLTTLGTLGPQPGRLVVLSLQLILRL